VGFPRTGLLTSKTSLAAASASRDVADPLASSSRRTSAPSSSLRDEPIFNRRIAAIACVSRAAMASYPLQVVRSGRHALDESGCARTTRVSTRRLVGDVAVKNLRIATSTVLLLNFSEVSALHLSSTGVTM
jgi:hypothetical protein